MLIISICEYVVYISEAVAQLDNEYTDTVGLNSNSRWIPNTCVVSPFGLDLVEEVDE